MHILVSILGLLGAGLFWWYRLRAAGAAVRDVADMAGRARGAVKRRRFRNLAAGSPFADLDDPVVGDGKVVEEGDTTVVAMMMLRGDNEAIEIGKRFSTTNSGAARPTRCRGASCWPNSRTAPGGCCRKTAPGQPSGCWKI